MKNKTCKLYNIIALIYFLIIPFVVSAESEVVNDQVNTIEVTNITSTEIIQPSGDLDLEIELSSDDSEVDFNPSDSDFTDLDEFNDSVYSDSESIYIENSENDIVDYTVDTDTNCGSAISLSLSCSNEYTNTDYVDSFSQQFEAGSDFDATEGNFYTSDSLLVSETIDDEPNTESIEIKDDTDIDESDLNNERYSEDLNGLEYNNQSIEAVSSSIELNSTNEVSNFQSEDDSNYITESESNDTQSYPNILGQSDDNYVDQSPSNLDPDSGLNSLYNSISDDSQDSLIEDNSQEGVIEDAEGESESELEVLSSYQEGNEVDTSESINAEESEILHDSEVNQSTQVPQESQPNDVDSNAQDTQSTQVSQGSQPNEVNSNAQDTQSAQISEGSQSNEVNSNGQVTQNSQNSQNSKNSQPKSHEQENYSPKRDRIDNAKPDLDTQQNTSPKTTNQISNSSIYINASDNNYPSFNNNDISESKEDYKVIGVVKFKEYIVTDVDNKLESSPNVYKTDVSNQGEINTLKSVSHTNEVKIKVEEDSISIVKFDIEPIESNVFNLIETNSIQAFDKRKVNNLSEDTNLDGCVDLIGELEGLSIDCNFLNEHLDSSIDKPQLNLSRTKNLFNTKKVVINGEYLPYQKLEVHFFDNSKTTVDKIVAIVETDEKGNFVYLYDTVKYPSSGSLYVQSEDVRSINYPFEITKADSLAKPIVFSMCKSPYSKAEKNFLCNPKDGFDIKAKSDYNTITKAYFNSTVSSGVSVTNSYTNIATINPAKSFYDTLRSGSTHRVILQNIDPLNPNRVSEPVEVYYKVHYPIFNPVLLPLFILLSLLGVVSLYDLYKFKKSEFIKKYEYAKYNLFKNSNI